MADEMEEKKKVVTTERREEKEKAGKERIMPKVTTAKKLNLKPDFKYIVRLANTDIDGTRTVVFGLTAIPGIGLRVAEGTVNMLGLPQTELIGNLSDTQLENLERMLHTLSQSMPGWMLNRPRDMETGQNNHIVGAELDLRRKDDINLMKMIRCYKGIRHEQGQKVRGQRTRSNGRTGLTVGVTRKAVLAAKRAAEEKEKKAKEKSGQRKK